MSGTGTENLTETVTNGTARVPSTPEGMAVAYGSLLIMALIPIFFGAFRSVKTHREQKKNGTTETMTRKDAAMFPIIASGALFSLYIVFKLSETGDEDPWELLDEDEDFHMFSKEYINLLLTAYFFCLGVLALCHLASPLMSKLVPASIPNVQYKIHFTKKMLGISGSPTEDIINYTFTSYDVVCLIGCSIVGLWYLLQKHWIGNNLFGLAFAINGVELLHLNNVVTGAILLSGLFVYDIFWVFGTNVMVTVAKSFEAPIKLVFPQDLLEKGLNANNFAMLGLGDIVIPGIFIALLLRFDQSLKRKTNTYFYASFIAYVLGLAATIFVMHVFKHAQPALLYLVPACLGTPLLLAVIKGDLKAMLKYEDAPEKNEKTKEGKKEKKKQ